MSEAKMALVLGATGGIGGEMAGKLLARGWQVRALHRNPELAPQGEPRPQWVKGDAMQAQDVVAAAQGASLIVHAVNPPGYRNWGQLVLPMLESTIAAARAVGARILLPGTVYNFGPDAFLLLSEASPQHPLTRKGAIRAEMERRLRVAAEGGVHTLILRAGDFFGPKAGNNWFAQGLVSQGRPLSKISYPGNPGIGHAWAYLPDVAETLARLLDREGELARFASFHFGGYWLDGQAMVEAVRRAAGDPTIAAARFPWWMVNLAAPFVETLRELRKMRYLWRTPVRLDDTRLLAFLGGSPYTPIEQAIRSTLEGAGCLPAHGRAPAPAMG